MQHYGIPTRLFDWSEVLGVSLAFAVLNYSTSSDYQPCIYVLDPEALNKKSGMLGVQELPSEGFPYRTIYWEKKPFAPKHPIAVDPPLQNERMFAQKATFTVHGDDPRGLEQQCPEVLRKVILPIEALDAAREFLDYADLTQYSIYPDIVGMARYIARKAFGEAFG
jgi:FRG domain